VPLPLALLVVPVGSALGDLRHRRPALRTAFNAAQLVIAFALAGTILQVLLGTTHFGPDERLGFELVLALIPSGGAMYVSNIVMTGIAIALHSRAPLASVLAEDFGPIDILGHLMLLGLAPIFVIVTQRNVLLAPLLFVTVLAVYRSTRAAMQRQHEALHDQLTGLPNRRYFDTRLDEATAAARRDDLPLAVLLIDLDRFKEVNDNLGHHIGDELLVAVGHRLRGLEGVDTAARLGGDEFAVLLTDPEVVEHVETAAATVVEELERAFTVASLPLQIGGSVGIATFPQHGRESLDLTRRADAAMYAAKRTNSGYRFAEASSGIGPGRVGLLADLPEGIAAGQIQLAYQPKVDARLGTVTGFEALLRWDHPVLGLLEPSVFVPMVEHTELIGGLTEHVLSLALSARARWEAAGHGLTVAVNISACDLQDVRFPETVQRYLRGTGVEPRDLELEITENAIMADHGRASRVLAELRELGVRLTIDDFGTGYSSLAHLRALPIDAVKIDRGFVSGMSGSPADAVIVRSVIELAHGLGMSVVAEGVEELHTLDRLVAEGCDEIQGYLISHPLGADRVLAWLGDFEPLRTGRSLAPRPVGRRPAHVPVP
jgi:diguanylate cyclase (GGDEF)-like protein